MTEEVGKTLLAVVIIALLAIFLYTIGKAFFANTEYQQAKATMSDLADSINNLQLNSVQEFTIESPKGWFIIKDGDNICFCRAQDYNKNVNNCRGSQYTVCQNFSQVIIPEGCDGIVIKEAKFTIPIVGISISGTDNMKIYANPDNCMSLSSVPIEAYLEKTSNNKVVFTKYKSVFTPNSGFCSGGPCWIINAQNNQKIEADIVMTAVPGNNGETYYLDLSSYLTQSIQKQTVFFSSSNINSQLVSPNQYIGDLNSFMFFGTDPKGTIFLSSKGILREPIGKVDETGAVWLAQDFLNQLYDISSQITFDSTKTIQIQSQNPTTLSLFGQLTLQKGNQITLYKTNLITSPSWGQKLS